MPHKTLLPVIDKVASDLGENTNVFKVNVDENGDLAQKYGVRGIPTLIFLKMVKRQNTCWRSTKR